MTDTPRKLFNCLSGLFIIVLAARVVAGEADLTTLRFPNDLGVSETLSTRPIDERNPFFQSLGTNDRAWSLPTISPRRQSRMRPEVTALFRELADRSPEERQEYYTREGVAEALREEVESLLQYDRQDDSLRGYVDSAQRDFVDQTVARTRDATVDRTPRRASTLLPDLIGRFAVTKLIGRGGMGEVYLARDPIIDRMMLSLGRHARAGH